MRILVALSPTLPLVGGIRSEFFTGKEGTELCKYLKTVTRLFSSLAFDLCHYLFLVDFSIYQLFLGLFFVRLSVCHDPFSQKPVEVSS